MKHIPVITARELEIMELIWQHEKMPAQDVASHFLKEEHGGYHKNTTYTFLSRLIKKKVLKRQEPGFLCIPLLTRQDVQIKEAQNFLNRLYNGSFCQLFSQFAKSKMMTKKDIEQIRRILDQYDEKK